MERVDWRKVFESVARFCGLQRKSISENDIILSDNIVRLENVIRSLGLADMLKKMYMQSA